MEMPTKFIVMGRNNYSLTNEQRLHGAEFPATLDGLAMALDTARAEAVERHGYSGLGAGAWVEAVYDDDEDNNIVVESRGDPDLSDLPLKKSRLALRRWAAKFGREQHWNGQNYISVSAENVLALCEYISSSA